MKKLILGLALSVACSASFAAESLSIGVVDFTEVFTVVPQGKSKLDSMKMALQPNLDALKKKQEVIASDLKDLQREAPTLDEKTRASREDNLLQRQQAFEQEVMALRDGEVKKEQAAAAEFEADLRKAVDHLAESGDYDMILNKQVVPFAKATLDLTQKVISVLKGEDATGA